MIELVHSIHVSTTVSAEGDNIIMHTYGDIIHLDFSQ